MPRINMRSTGENINRLRKYNHLSVRDVQEAMGFNTPQAIFKWQRGDTLPSLDNLVILAELFQVTINDIVVIDR